MSWTAVRARAVVVDDELEPLRPTDLTVLASDFGPAPMNIAAVLLLDGADDGTTTVPDLLAERALAVPRLRQVLVVRPRRAGGPVWRADPIASPARHISIRALPGGGERAVLDEAARLATDPLDRARPMWAARWLTGWDSSGARRGALVVVLHHVLVDGIGGLGMLQALADPPPGQPGGVSAPHPGGPPHRLRAWLLGLLELGVGTTRPALAARTSINRPTGPARHIEAVGVPLAEFRDGAHRHGGTVNDAMVAAVVGALTRLLAARGEQPRSLVVSMPVSAQVVSHREAGNDNGVLPVAVPTGLDFDERVRWVAAATARRKARPRGHSAAPLGWAFRALARRGRLRPCIERQRLIHTFETNVRGPATALRIAGSRVSAMFPAAISPGNVGASFAVLSYAGQLVVDVVTDPSIVPATDGLAALLADELAAITGTPVPTW